ncbi:hypothetical protein BJV82DRAFT_669841 [Fennellomyces sp. T-0311]|nr:hypothetical protein BJV82DRAFT_669841 [Fennellomyces sp. T-0311]
MEGFYIALGMFVSAVSITQYDQVSLMVSLKAQDFPVLYNIISLMVPRPNLFSFSRTNLRPQSDPGIYEGRINWVIHNASFTQSYMDLCQGLSQVQNNFKLFLEMAPNQENMLDFFFGFILSGGCSIVPPGRFDRANGEAFKITHNDLPGLQLIANMLNRVMRIDVERPVASVGPYGAADQHKYILHVDNHASLRLLEHLKGVRSRGLYLSAKLDETEHILRYGGLSENQQSAYHLGLTLDEFRGPPRADGTYHPAVLALT